MPATPAAEPPAEAQAPAEAVGPLMRGIAVLRAVSDAGGRMSLGDLVRTTGLARSTVDRVTATLARMGYVRLDGHEARLEPRLMELGNAYLAAAGLPGPLGPLAERLADELDESVSLAVPDADGIRFVHQTTRRRAMSLTFRIGDLLPVERTAPGPLFAAVWPGDRWAAWRRGTGCGTVAGADFEERAARAAEDGWALDDQLIEPGLVALAVPVRDPRGRTVCALSVVSHTSRHSADALRRALLPRVRETVAAVERELRRAPTAAEPPAAETAATGEAGGGTAVRGLAHWTAASKQELGAEFVESLARGLTVITAFGEGRAELGLTAVAEATGLARATARRALITLEHLGYVTSQDRTFRLTPRVLALGCPPLSRTTLSDIAVPHMAELVRHVHDSASLAVLEGEDIRYTARVATERIMSVNITIGTRFPAYAASMGRVLLAGLPADERTARIGGGKLRALTPRTVTDPTRLAALLDHVVDEGYALVDEELEEGLRSLAVPVRDHTGRTVAALNVAMHSARRTLDECLTEVLPQLRATAAGIESDLRIAGRFTRITEV
ncbi:IclR family transcriptional regulator domain-containing protein [Streptomyces formicae]|uniref:Helix-turn-helix domain-containing protein n=1 Tax=Streptomyces formicae TaxID=1616117 RepID=A0ABY3WS21_9ACTN|nr:IclR family transcriptional regulator C-terminal domain-containing protein [Streptomyces formicae]UNM13602.1 helix-turn-helix domain-containing protein [Streptomyces formicae]